MTPNERVKEVRKELGLTLEKFGDRLGVKKNAISQIETGKNALTEQNLKAICREFDVNETWLRAGEGEMFAPSTREQEIASIVAGVINEDSSLRSLFIEAIAGLTDEQIQVAHDIIMSLSEKLKKSHQSDDSL